MNTVKVPTCGVRFHSEDELIDILLSFNRENYHSLEIINHARKFSEKEFKRRLYDIISNVVNDK